MNIPFLDMKKEAEFLLKNGLSDDLTTTVSSGQYLFGPKSEELETKLSEKFNAEAILVGSGTDAITLSLLAYDIGFGDTIAIPAFSAIPTAVAVKMTGANIRYLDISALTGSLSSNIFWTDDFEDIRAVIPVHLYGNVSEIEMIASKCKEKDITIIEDCAQAFGSKSSGLAGTFGHTGAFSFYPTKNLGCFGDGGVVITKDTNIAQKIRELRFYGQKSRAAMGVMTGMNSRMDELQCTVLLKKLSILPTIEERRLAIFEKYKEAFSEYSIKWSPGSMPHLFPILVKSRSKFIRLMKEKGVGTAIHYPFTLPAIIEKDRRSFPMAEKFASEVVSLPFHPWLTDEEVAHIINTTKICLLEVGK